MLLLDRSGAKADAFSRIASADELPVSNPLAPLASVDAVLAASGGAPVGALVDNTIKADALGPYLDRLALIAIHFPSGTDGRGFSLARQLRQRGFKGVLRASGPLFSDQFPQAIACGFDEVEIPDASAARQPVEQWLAALASISLAYQRDYGAGEKILARRQARGGADV